MSATATIPTTGERRISEDLGLWEPKRALTLEAALAHTRRIKVLRYVLMALSVAIVGVLIWQFMSDQSGFEPVNDPSESVRMVNPRYSGRTGDGLPFYLIADTAVRRRSDLDTVLLDNPVLEFIRDEGVETSTVIAQSGSYNDMSKILVLETDVNLETDDGNSCDTTHARIFNVEKRIEGDKPIECVGEFGTVTGQTYAIEDAYRTFIFKDGMTADLVNEASASSDDSSFGFGGDGPININADKGIYKGDTTDLLGNVRVVQDGATITSDQMDIFRVQEKRGEDTGSVKLGAVRRIVATGDFRYLTAENDIRGRQGIYERDKNIMTVTGDVVVIQPGGNQVEAEKMTYNTITGKIQFSGDCSGPGCNGNGRTRIVIPGSGN
jgi:lipopolysaccharide transport protein LptA/LPS export ABC transporter protein LptC